MLVCVDLVFCFVYREFVFEKVFVVVWRIIFDKEGVGKEIVEKVDVVYVWFSGYDLLDLSF